MANFQEVSTFCIRVPDLNGALTILKNALILNDQLADCHPYIYQAACIFLLLNPRVLTWPFKACKMLIRLPIAFARWFVRSLGYNNTGIARNSFASRYQSINYGGNVPRDSVFSGIQSFGAYDEEDWDEEEDIPAYVTLLQIGVCVLLIRCVHFCAIFSTDHRKRPHSPDSPSGLVSIIQLRFSFLHEFSSIFFHK
ncbi:hypothetical protein EDD18DRAFT_1189930 [Armillaria luteobubalina]|uniref:Uncharacterized protein n=1 Tax=Armillaria luteobubalina TaxID=153913 RepID=A0AA39PT43_9AGAR|nr:hypothetical protein EDD18DRAFT_1189930 [Armillaria luteobubalina]